MVGYQTQMTPVSFSLRRKKQPGAKFGATVANVGDLDGDRYEDFAVAAPFENKGQGAVYIYRGAAGVILAGNLRKKRRVLTSRVIIIHFRRGASKADTIWHWTITNGNERIRNEHFW